MILMTVHGLTLDPATNSPILILRDVEGERTLPIWIGLLEATAIASELESVSFSRPMTHDLLTIMIGEMGYQVDRVEVCDLKENTFYAYVYLSGPKGGLKIDARPSDSIALALRTKAPIYVAPHVLEQSMPTSKVSSEDAEEKWKEILENMDPDDFGKYKM